MGHPEIPMKVRAAVLARAGCKPRSSRQVGECEECGDRRPIELHHLTYEYSPLVWDPPEPIYGHETEDNLRALCRGCHRGSHLDCNGDFWRDPEEMEGYWAPFYESLNKD